MKNREVYEKDPRTNTLLHGTLKFLYRNVRDGFRRKPLDGKPFPERNRRSSPATPRGVTCQTNSRCEAAPDHDSA